MQFRAALIAPLLAAALVAAPPSDHSHAQSNIPQAFLLGSWTGGLFPAPAVLSAEQCLLQPTVIFTRDVVLRATLTDQFYIQRLIETARGTGNGVDFHFAAAASANRLPRCRSAAPPAAASAAKTRTCCTSSASRPDQDPLPRLQRLPLPAGPLPRRLKPRCPGDANHDPYRRPPAR